MKAALKAAMTASISEVFETMFFMALEFDDQTTLDTCGIIGENKTLACEISFKGRFSGRFLLFIPETLLYILTKNFTALDQKDITDAHITGTIKEAVNMLAGGSLSKFDDTLVFQLSIPELVDVVDAVKPGKNQGEEEITVVTETTEGCLALRGVFNIAGECL